MHLRFFNVLAAFPVAAAVALPLSAAADEAAINAIWNSSEAARVAGDADVCCRFGTKVVSRCRPQRPHAARIC